MILVNVLTNKQVGAGDLIKIITLCIVLWKPINYKEIVSDMKEPHK